MVPRPRLDWIVSVDAGAGLTLVSAPAGTGKTVSVADWASRRPTAPIWVAVTEDVQQGQGQLWEDLFEALRSRGVSTPLREPGAVPSERAVLTALAARIVERPEPIEIVLDFDTAVSRSTASGLDYLMRHSADRLRLVLLSRHDPPLPLQRYLLAGTLNRVVAEDLAFTDDEAEQLVAARGLRLHRRALLVLTHRTQGWAAALVLASLLLAKQHDPDTAVNELTGRTGDLAEYMLTDVLDEQPPEVRTTLLQTSIVDTLHPGLVESLAGPHATSLLDSLARGGVFVDAAPNEPGCYRYHPLFREMLRSRLHVEAPGQVAPLHRAASSWFASQRRINEAISHVAATGDWDAVADLVVAELAVVQLLLSPTPRGWALTPLLSPVPDRVGTPAASVVRAAQALKNGDLATARIHLNNARSRWSTESVEARPRLSIELLEMALCAAAEEWDGVLGALTDAELCVAQLASFINGYPEVTSLMRSLKGRALLALGDLKLADNAFAEGTADHEPGHHVPPANQEPPAKPWRVALSAAVADCLGHRALIAAWRGQLRDAVRLAQQCRLWRSSTGCGALVVPAPGPTALAWVCIERNDLSGARRFLQLAREEAGADPDPFGSTMLSIARSRTHRAHDDVARAAAAVAAHPRRPRIPPWLETHLRLEVARVHVSAGRSDRATALTDRLSAPDPEVRVVQALAELAAGETPAADEVRAGQDAHLATRVTSLLVEAAAWARQGHDDRARQALNRSMRLAHPEQLRRPFTEAPDDVVALMPEATDLAPPLRGSTPPPGRDDSEPGLQLVTRSRGFGPAPQALTAREREILALMGDLLTNEEIARSLFVSVNTVRTHNRAILRKLGVSRRGEAVRRARQLGLLPPLGEVDRGPFPSPRIPQQRRADPLR